MKFNSAYSKKVRESNSKINEIILTSVLSDMYPKVMELFDERMQLLNKMYITAHKLYILCSTSYNIYDDKKINDLFDKAFGEIEEFEDLKLQEKINDIFYDVMQSIQAEIKDIAIELSSSAGKYGIYSNSSQLYAQIDLFVRQSYLRLRDLVVSVFNDIQNSTVDLENEVVKVIDNLKSLIYADDNNNVEQEDNKDILCRINEKFSDCNTKILGYKELNKLANKAGYTFDRQKGDHATFVKDGKIIVIPQGRPIGKGLSIKIQKDINRLNPSRNF